MRKEIRLSLGVLANVKARMDGSLTVKSLILSLRWWRQQPLLLVLISIIIVIALGIAFHQPIDRQLNTWKLLPQPERLTELYFTHPNNLPSTYLPGQAQTVRFTVHNLEYKTMTYHYEVVEQNQSGSQSQVLASGKFTIKQSVYQGESVNVTPTDLGARAKIVIELPSVNESIDYLVSKG